MVNGSAQDYRCFVATSTGHFALENAAGEVFTSRAGFAQDIPASEAVALWSCAGSSDPRPAGDITALDCHDLALTLLDVRGLASLTALDCSWNQLTELDLSGLASLEYLYAKGNPLAALNLSPSPCLKFVGYASRYLGYCESPLPSLTGEMVCHDGPLFWFHPDQAVRLLDATNDTLCAVKYTSPRTRPITRGEAEIRDIAYALKRTEPDAIAVAAPAMAALITGPCWLVPIPASNGSLDANLALCRALAGIVPGARIKMAISRSEPVESSTDRRRVGLSGLQPEDHNFVRRTGPIDPLPLYFVDNVITTGNTIRAARAVLGWGTGLAYADASSPFNHRLRQAAKSQPAVALAR
jgi:hypothetical protein